jgi:hypothetical protein
VHNPASIAAAPSVGIFEALDEAGLPDGVANMVTGPGSEVGDEIATHDGVDAVSFTGSSQVGQYVYESAVADGKRVQTELGGKNPTVVSDSADVQEAAEICAASAFGVTGQACTACSRAIVHTDVRNGNILVSAKGLEAVLDWEGAVRHGDPMQDLAWPTLRMWRFKEDEREVGGFAGRAPFVAGYERCGDTFDEERFHWWKVLGTLRWALGLASQSAAHLDERFRSIVMAASGRRVPELEWDLLMLIRPT